MGWTKVLYYLFIAITAGLLIVAGTLMHAAAAIVLTLIAPSMYQLVRREGAATALNRIWDMASTDSADHLYD